MSTVPIKDTSVAVDEFLDARRSVQNVQESCLAGSALWNQCAAILADIDSAIAGLRRPK